MRHNYGDLLRWRHTGPLAANAVASSPRVVFGAGEGYQVHRITIDPPVTPEGPLGEPEQIEEVMVQLHCDGTAFDIHLNSRMAGPLKGTSRRLALELGDRRSSNPILNPCPKGMANLFVSVMGGPNGVAGDFEVVVYGDYFYKDEAVANFFGPTFGDPGAVAQDPFRNRVLPVTALIPSTIDNLPKMSGGGARAVPPFTRPFITHSRNARPTTANVPYVLGGDNIVKPWENLAFDLGVNDGLIITHIGGVPHDYSRFCWIDLPDHLVPRDFWSFRRDVNEIPIGNPLEDYQGPRQIEKPVVARGERLEVFIQDNGTVVPPNGIMIGIWAVKAVLA